MCRPQVGLCWKINLIWLHSMRVSLSAYELFSRLLNKPHLITFHERILVHFWTFQMPLACKSIWIYRVIKKTVNTLMGKALWYNLKQSLHVHHQHILRISHRWFKKNVDISLGVSLLEKQNWYNRDHLGWISITC